MLKPRIRTAVVMLLVLLGALLAPRPEPLLLLLIVLASCALWEWLRLILPQQAQSRDAMAMAGSGVLFALLNLLAVQWFDIWLGAWTTEGASAATGAGLQVPPAVWPQALRGLITQWLMPLVALSWCIGATLAVMCAPYGGVTPCATQRCAASASASESARAVASARLDVAASAVRPAVWPAVFPAIAAVAAVIAVWTALVLLYQTHGVWMLVSLMALVWCADVAAYFTGRAFGRHKLVPGVSPGKTWEGAAGGVLAAVAWTWASMRFDGSFGAALSERHALPVALVLAALLAALSIVGDLYESLLKRRAGVKDSSALLPGHGGVLDRIDALLPVAPAAYCLLHLGA